MSETVTKFKGIGQWRSQARKLEDGLTASAMLEEFHGTHNQKSHGKRGSSSGFQVTERSRKAIAASGEKVSLAGIGIKTITGADADTAWATRDNDKLWAGAKPEVVSWDQLKQGIETEVKTKHVKKVVLGEEPLREGYPQRVYKLDNGSLMIADGHTRAAMHSMMETQKIDVIILPIQAGRDAQALSLGGISASAHAMLEEFHGTHNQKSHGNRSRGGGGARGKKVRSLADDIISRATQAEPGITSALQKAAGAAGGSLVGLEHKLKKSDSLSRKIAKKAASKGVSVEEYADSVSDAARYTVLLPHKSYVDNIVKTQAALQDAGMEIIAVEQQWKEGTTYNAVHVIAQDKATGTKTEVQFHTDASLRVKNLNHPVYEQWRKENDPQRRVSLNDYMVHNWDNLDFPEGLDRLGAAQGQKLV